jgi:hypothetical protein
MPGARTLGFSLLIAAAACTPTTGSQAPKPLKPEDGPKAFISVDYQGGLINRRLRASFRTEQTAYVLVGHLAGDGRIRVLFPESPDESGLVRARKYHQTTSVAAHYDALPSLFSFTMSPYRGLGAMHDSYDGAGHGYVFIVASRTPLRYDLLYDYAGWAELEMEGYTRHHDPRYAVRSFADVLAGGARYTLKFASSLTSTSYYSYAMRAWDCSVLSSLGMFANPALWSTWYSSMYGFGISQFGGCGPIAYPRYANRPIFTTVALPPGRTPTGDPAPSLDRPGRRGLGTRAEAPTRTTLTRVSPSMPRDPAGDRNAFDRNRSRRPAYGATRGRGTGSDTFTGSSRASDRRDGGSRASSPSSSRTGSSSTGSASTTRASDRGSSSSSGASSSSGSRSDRPATSSPRGGTGKPDQRR